MQVLKYKGYVTKIEFSTEDKCLHGKIDGIADIVTFEADNEHEIEKGWCFESSDFINRLLIRKAKDRLGYYGPEQVKEHDWIKNFNWADLYNKKINAPFKPEGEGNRAVLLTALESRHKLG